MKIKIKGVREYIKVSIMSYWLGHFKRKHPKIFSITPDSCILPLNKNSIRVIPNIWLFFRSCPTFITFPEKYENRVGWKYSTNMITIWPKYIDPSEVLKCTNSLYLLESTLVYMVTSSIDRIQYKQNKLKNSFGKSSSATRKKLNVQ